MAARAAIRIRRLEAGIAHGAVLLPAGRPGALAIELLHRGKAVARAEAVAEGETGIAPFALALPPEILADGLQTVTLRLRDAPDIQAHLSIVAGSALDGDLATELDQLRAEVELLKAAFRRHCRETGG